MLQLSKHNCIVRYIIQFDAVVESSQIKKSCKLGQGNCNQDSLDYRWL